MKKQFVTLGGLGIAVVTCVALSSGGSATAAQQIDGANLKKGSVTGDKLASQTVTSGKIAKNGVGNSELQPGSVSQSKLSPGLLKKINGVNVSATTILTDRTDNGHGSPPAWAKDSFNRTITLSLAGTVEDSKCGGGTVATCYFYTGTISDNGTFKTIADAKSPNDGVTISGKVSGQFAGTSRVRVYADTLPDGNLMPAVGDDDSPGTSGWAKQLFADGTHFGDVDLASYAFSYGGTGTCETWLDASDNNDGTDDSAGDIKGVNKCG